MIAQLTPDANIPSSIYELAASHKLGTPIKKQKRKAVQIFLIQFLRPIAQNSIFVRMACSKSTRKKMRPCAGMK